MTLKRLVERYAGVRSDWLPGLHRFDCVLEDTGAIRRWWVNRASGGKAIISFNLHCPAVLCPQFAAGREKHERKTIEMLRAQCRIDIDDATEDELLTLYFTAARRRAENFTIGNCMKTLCLIPIQTG